MHFVPWRHVADWKCTSCGDCCRLYSVVINFHEWLGIVKNFGVGQTIPGFDRLYIKRGGDGSCSFLCALSSKYVCGLQNMKPKACKLWPFKVLDKPKFGFAADAAYEYGKGTLFVYVDSMCNGIRYGRSTWEFSNYTLREFVEIALDARSGQARSTANMSFAQRLGGPTGFEVRRYF